MVGLSLRRLWTIYKRTALAQGTGARKRDLSLSQLAFYTGARGVLRVLDHMIAEGDCEGLHKVIQRHRRQPARRRPLATLDRPPLRAHQPAYHAAARRLPKNAR